MVDRGCEVNKRRPEGVIGWELYVQAEQPTLVGAVGGTHNGPLPCEHAVVHRPREAHGRGVVCDVCQFLVQSPQSGGYVKRSRDGPDILTGTKGQGRRWVSGA